MKLIDTHCHLENEAFDGDRVAVIERAANQGIRIITSACEKPLWSKGLEISNQHETVYASVGLHPAFYNDCDSAIDFIHENHSSLVAVGEIGLDHYIIRDHTERENQEQAFRTLIKLANELKLPVQVHSRSAGAKAIAVLEDCNANSVHMHAYDGKSGHARHASRELDYFFSIPTSVVRSPQKKKLVKAIDIEHLLLETDSPVLGPTKEERNVPSNLHLGLKEVATILRRDEQELGEIILENSRRLYPTVK